MTGKLQSKNTVFVMLALLVLGVLMVISSGKDKSIQTDEAESVFDEVDYEERLENRLKKIISQIDGVGEVNVMITMEGSAMYTYATDTANDTRADGDFKRESTVVLSVKGTNTKEAVVSGYLLPNIKGAAVVCSRRLTAELKSKVIGVVSAALGIPTNKIYVTD